MLSELRDVSNAMDRAVNRVRDRNARRDAEGGAMRLASRTGSLCSLARSQ